MVAVHRSPVCLEARLIKLLSAFLPRSGRGPIPRKRISSRGEGRGEKVSSSSSSSSSSIVEILGWSKRKNTKTRTPTVTLSSRDRSRSYTKPRTFISVPPIENTEYSRRIVARVVHASRGGNRQYKDWFGVDELSEERGEVG